MDKHSKQTRSYNMSRIRSAGTKPEEQTRKYLFSQGFRYRKNVKKLPGSPDIVLAKYKTAVFVNGCFWHAHEGCPKYVQPLTNTDYWSQKLQKNRQRDEKNISLLRESGWKVIIVWECELGAGSAGERLERLKTEITGT